MGAPPEKPRGEHLNHCSEFGRDPRAIPSVMPDQLLLVSVGNTRTRAALVRDGQLEPSHVVHNQDVAAMCRAIAELGGASDPGSPGVPVLIASVNRPVSDAVEQHFRGLGRHVSRLGTSAGDLPIPIQNALEDASTVGADRLLDALGAYSRAKAACVVIDAGTAITVDFVDGEGVFHGGAIAPGIHMMLAALHEKTASLPRLTLTDAGSDVAAASAAPFGRTTQQAMLVGVLNAARGLAHRLIDRYAEFYGAYPRVIATGGDAPLLFENDELVEHIVPDLPLVGMLEAFHRLEQLDDEAIDEGGAAHATDEP